MQLQFETDHAVAAAGVDFARGVAVERSGTVGVVHRLVVGDRRGVVLECQDERRDHVDVRHEAAQDLCLFRVHGDLLLPQIAAAKPLLAHQFAHARRPSAVRCEIIGDRRGALLARAGSAPPSRRGRKTPSLHEAPRRRLRASDRRFRPFGGAGRGRRSGSSGATFRCRGSRLTPRAGTRPRAPADAGPTSQGKSGPGRIGLRAWRARRPVASGDGDAIGFNARPRRRPHERREPLSCCRRRLRRIPSRCPARRGHAILGPRAERTDRSVPASAVSCPPRRRTATTWSAESARRGDAGEAWKGQQPAMRPSPGVTCSEAGTRQQRRQPSERALPQGDDIERGEGAAPGPTARASGCGALALSLSADSAASRPTEGGPAAAPV